MTGNDGRTLSFQAKASTAATLSDGKGHVATGTCSLSSHSGTGANIIMTDGFPVVIQADEGTPAFEAGILTGDIIVAIDDQPTKDHTMQDIIANDNKTYKCIFHLTSSQNDFYTPLPSVLLKALGS